MKANPRLAVLLALIPCAVAASIAMETQVTLAGDDSAASTGALNRAAAGDVDVSRSRVYTFVGKTGFGHEHGVTGRLKAGSIRLGADRDAGQLVFDLTSFSADTREARRYVGLEGETDASTQEQVTTNMLGAYVLDTEHNPTATFVINSALPVRGNQPGGAKRYQLEGQFTLHGLTRPLRIFAEARAESGAIRLRGAFALLQTDYGIKPFSKALGAVGVTDKLKIYGDILIVAAGN
jgi:polyisoprenoid-binding protein YceI